MLSPASLLAASSRFSKAHFGLLFLGLMWALPFLYYYHQYPLTTFYQEWLASLLGMFAAFFLLNRNFLSHPEIPQVVLLPAGLIFLVWLQVLMGRVAYTDQALLFSFYMLWIMLMMVLGRAAASQLGFETVAGVLAVFLLAGSELNALSGVLQHYRIHTFLDQIITAKTGIAVFGNLAQPNHFADYMTLGLVSLGLLQVHLRNWHTVLLALPLLFVMVLSGSRSSWIYLGVLVVMSWFWRKRRAVPSRLLFYSVGILAGFALMHFIVQLPWFAGQAQGVTTVQRMMSGETSGSIRLYLWQEAWMIFKQFPAFGAGWGQFAWQHFQLGPVLRDPQISGLYNNAHNLLFHFAAETGLAGVLLLLAALTSWLKSGMRDWRDTHHWWGVGVLSVLLIHSFLEYPLWYAYFLGVAAILLGALDRQTMLLQLKPWVKHAVPVVVVLGIVFLWQVREGYQRLETLTLTRHSTDPEATAKYRNELARLRQVPLFQPYADLYLAGFIEVSEAGLSDKLVWNENITRFVPLATGNYRRAMLLALANMHNEARLQMERAIWAFPRDFPHFRDELERLAQKDAEHFAGLLEFSVQKFEEYGSAISVK